MDRSDNLHANIDTSFLYTFKKYIVRLNYHESVPFNNNNRSCIIYILLIAYQATIPIDVS
jgi:hypothetical protein